MFRSRSGALAAALLTLGAGMGAAEAEALLAELPDPAAAFDPSHGHGALYA